MNLHDISLRIENPSLLVSSDIPVLQELCHKYPYSQLLSILYLKALAKDKAMHLDEEVDKQAYKITDRARLFEILNEEEEEELVKEIFISDEQTVTNGGSDEIRDTSDGKVEINEVTNEGSDERRVTSDEKMDTKEVTFQLNIEERDRTLDLDVISNAISGVFDKEFEPEREDLEVKNLTPKVESIKGSKQHFTTWLRAGENEKVTIRKVDQLIETFIQEDPKISQPKKEFYSPIKQAKKSLDSENIIYTETLANILGLQGNYPKAILAYEQLCLTFPEKKSYFVQKIKELKEKLNS